MICVIKPTDTVSILCIHRMHVIVRDLMYYIIYLQIDYRISVIRFFHNQQN